MYNNHAYKLYVLSLNVVTSTSKCKTCGGKKVSCVRHIRVSVLESSGTLLFIQKLHLGVSRSAALLLVCFLFFIFFSLSLLLVCCFGSLLSIKLK